MADGIYVALSGAIAQSTNLETTAVNLANASTDGYQRARPVFREELSRAGATEPGLHYASVNGTSLDTRRGTLRATDGPLDFAMPEGTYLAVDTARGERYTRAASLSVGSDGFLRTTHGDAVLGEDGKRIRASGGPTSLRIDDTGQLWRGVEVAGRVKLVTFAQPAGLSHDTGPLLVQDPPPERQRCRGARSKWAISKSRMRTSSAR